MNVIDWVVGNKIKLIAAGVVALAVASGAVFAVHSYNSAITRADAAEALVKTRNAQLATANANFANAVGRIDDFNKALSDQAAQTQHLASVATQAREETRQLTTYFSSGQFKEALNAKPQDTVLTVNADVASAFGLWDSLTRSPAAGGSQSPTAGNQATRP